MVKKAIYKAVLVDLTKECSSLKKTNTLTYQKLEMQEYLKVLYPDQARVILKSRCQALDIKTQNAFKFQEGDTICRKCGIHEETFDHIINCGFEANNHITIDVTNLQESSELLTYTLMRTANRINSFCDLTP